MFNGRIGFDGTAIAKTFVIGSYFRWSPKSREKAQPEEDDSTPYKQTF
jgi:hypothetical protein